jgi:two-component system sensor histidine kinase PilS (NtrC family)
MSKDFDRRSKQYLIFRLLIVLLGFGLVTFYQLCLEPAFRQHTFFYLYALLGIYLLFGVLLLALYPRWRGRHEIMRWQVVADFIIQSLLIWGTGGVLSIFSPLLFVTLVAATSIISARGAIILASMATLFLIVTTVAHGLGVVPVTSGKAGWLRGEEKSAFIVSYLLASILALFAISTLGSRFSHGLRSMEGIQSEILENMAEGLIAVDREGHLVHLNKEARKLLGFKKAERDYPRLDLEALFPGDSYVFLRDAFRQERQRRFSTVVSVPGRKELPVEVKISSVYGDLGEARFRIGLVSDLTLKREVEAAERRIQKLEDLQVMALGIAHEIRNPLASIRGCVQEIKRLAKNSAQETKYMDIVCRESDRLDRILEEFLTYARSGPVDLVPLDLLQVIEEAMLLLRSRPDFGARFLSLVTPPDRPRVFGDRNRLIQVFLNLGINAIDATPAADGKITISLRPKRFASMQAGALEGDLVAGIEVEIADNGSGMGPTDLKKVFTPFFTTKPKGNGLGLSVVGRIVRDHMGVVDVASVEGQGTTFRLWFPVLGTKGKEEEGADPKARTELYCNA